MRRLAEAGVIVLRSGGVLEARRQPQPGAVVPIDGIPVAGYNDPLEARTDTIGAHPLELQGAAFTEEEQRVVSWFDELPSRPKLVLIHQHGLAHALLRHVATDGGAPVTILTGHDHVQHIEREGTSLLVDGGTLGAGGIFADRRAARRVHRPAARRRVRAGLRGHDRHRAGLRRRHGTASRVRREADDGQPALGPDPDRGRVCAEAGARRRSPRRPRGSRDARPARRAAATEPQPVFSVLRCKHVW